MVLPPPARGAVCDLCPHDFRFVWVPLPFPTLSLFRAGAQGPGRFSPTPAAAYAGQPEKAAQEQGREDRNVRNAFLHRSWRRNFLGRGQTVDMCLEAA